VRGGCITLCKPENIALPFANNLCRVLEGEFSMSRLHQDALSSCFLFAARSEITPYHGVYFQKMIISYAFRLLHS
jgi:hypothetical protein